MECRALLSISLQDPAVYEAFANHTLSAEQMEALNVSLMQWRGQPTYVRPGEWIVGLEYDRAVSADDELAVRDWAGPDERAPELQQAFDGWKLGVKFVRYLGTKHSFLISVPEGLSSDRLTGVMRSLDRFSFIEPNQVGALAAVDPYRTLQYALNNTGQVQGWVSDADIDAPEAWNITRGYTGTVVAVLDTGVDYDHPDLAANTWANPGEIAGNDKVKGGGNNDLLYGSAGNDTLNGEDGSDTMYGGIGDDYLISYGDFASDTLYGAAGNDRADVDSLLDVQPNNDVETWILH